MIPCPTCCASCTIFSDDFSADNLATDWDDRAGTWAVASGKLTTTSANALIVTTTIWPGGGLTAVFVQADITCATNSDIGRLIAAYVDDDNYWFAEVQPGASGTLKLFERSGGTNTQQGSTASISFSAGGTLFVALCIADGIVTASASTDPGFFGTTTVAVSVLASPALTSTKYGCGTGSGSSDVKFDIFGFAKHKTDDPTCPSCASACQFCNDSDDVAPATVQVVVEGYTDTAPLCTEMNGTWILPQTSSCGWSIEISPAIADGRTTLAAAMTGDTTIVIEFGPGANVNHRVFDTAFSSDCLGWDEVELPMTSNPAFDCSGGTVTYTITSL